MDKYKNIGTISLSDRVVVSDPCYERGTWCMCEGVIIKPGEYSVYIELADEGEFGMRVARLICFNNQNFDGIEGALGGEWVEFDEIGVDSGQAGIFDESIYPSGKEDMGDYDDPSTFSGECCWITMKEFRGGVLTNGKGAVSSSGYGDGVYCVKARHDGDVRVALMIDFGLTE